MQMTPSSSATTRTTMLPGRGSGASSSSYHHDQKVAHFAELFAGLNKNNSTASRSGSGGGGQDCNNHLDNGGLQHSHGEHNYDNDGDIDNFGTPELLLRQTARKSIGQSVSVIDACILCDEEGLCEILRKGVTRGALNKKDPKTGRTGLAYACAQGYLGILDILVGMGPILDVNAPDNEGNTPLHLAAEAGHADVLSNLLAFFRDVQIDSRNHSGLTPLMKAAIQGRTNCAKVLLFAGACPALRDAGRCLCATEWARLCGRHSTADTIERFPHTSCLLHPSSQPNPSQSIPSQFSERSAMVAQRLAYSSATPQTPHRVNGHTSYDSPKGLTVRRTYRAASEPNLQTRNSIQLQLEQLQQIQPTLRRKPSWIRRKLSQALGMDRQQRKSLEPGYFSEQIGRFSSASNLLNANSNVPFSCISGNRNTTFGDSHGKPKMPLIVPKVKIQHTDSQAELTKQDNADKVKHKLDFKKVMMFRKRSSSTSTGKSKKI